MTKKEAIEILQGAIKKPNTKDGYLGQAIKMAIKALEPKTIQEIQAESEKYQKAFEDGYEQGYTQARFDYEQEPCEDAISRQAVLDELNKWDWQELYLPIHFKENIIDVVPSVNQEPKTGQWEYVQYDYNPKLGNWHCSECRCVIVACVDKNEKGGIPLYKYCPNCGANMGSEE